MCVSKWENKPNVLVGYDLKNLALDILATCIFGMDFDTLNGKLSEPLDAYNHFVNTCFNPARMMLPWVSKLPLKWNSDMERSIVTFDKYIWQMMDQTKKIMKEKEKENQTENSVQPPVQTKSIIELMYENNLPETTIRDNVVGFFVAGHETTANALAWLFAVFVTHPEIQEKARQEVFEKAPNELTWDSLKELTYIDGLIKESLRVYIPATVISGRYAKNATVIGNVQVPAGTYIDLNHVTMAHDPKIWGDPNVIRPERWFPENLTKEQRRAWTPFSGGPRICIGMNFSLLEQKIFVACLLKRYKEIKLDPTGEITPVHPGLPTYTPNIDKLIVQLRD
jgi:cytochrome P450